MAKKIKIELTEAQLRAIMDMRDDVDAGIGCSDRDHEYIKQVRLIDRMLKSNGYVQTE